MLRIETRLLRAFDKGKVYQVQSTRTFYTATVLSDEVRLIGPGVDHSYLIPSDISDDLSEEGQAMIACLLWEEET